MTKSVLGVVSWALLAGSLAAQRYSVSASVPQAGMLTTSCGGGLSTTSIPVGPVTPRTIAATGCPDAAAYTAWDPTVPDQLAPVAFTVRGSTCVTATPLGAYANVSMTLDLHLDSGGGGPLTGVLRVRKAPLLQLGFAAATVDVGADGSEEMSPSTDQQSLVVDVPGGSIDVRVFVQTSAGSIYGTPLPEVGRISLYGEFFPGRTVVDHFATFPTVVSLVAAPVGSDRWQLATTAPAALDLQPFATVFGLQPTNVPIGPGLTQLVRLDTWLPGTSLVFDLPPMPPGFALYAQGVVIAPDGALFSSNSVRALWF